MLKRWATTGFYFAACSILAVNLDAQATNADRIAKIKEAIKDVQTNPPSSVARMDAADRLDSLTRKINPARIDDQTISDMVGLLAPPDDSVRAEVAIALGNLGPRAKAASPELVKILYATHCDEYGTGITVGSAIVMAIEKIDKKHPPLPKCESW